MNFEAFSEVDQFRKELFNYFQPEIDKQTFLLNDYRNGMQKVKESIKTIIQGIKTGNAATVDHSLKIAINALKNFVPYKDYLLEKTKKAKAAENEKTAEEASGGESKKARWISSKSFFFKDMTDVDLQEFADGLFSMSGEKGEHMQDYSTRLITEFKAFQTPPNAQQVFDLYVRYFVPMLQLYGISVPPIELPPQTSQNLPLAT